MLKDGANTCVLECITENAIVIKGTCLVCDKTCDGCRGTAAIDCNKCATGLKLKDSLCIDDCGGGYFDEVKSTTNSSTNITVSSTTCRECHSTCGTCNGDTSQNCTSCQSGSFLHTDIFECHGYCLIDLGYV